MFLKFGTTWAPLPLIPIADAYLRTLAGELTRNFSEQLQDSAHLSDTPECCVERSGLFVVGLKVDSWLLHQSILEPSISALGSCMCPALSTS